MAQMTRSAELHRFPLQESGNETLYMVASEANRATVSELMTFLGPQVHVEIAKGADVIISEIGPADAISAQLLIPTNLVFASSAALSVQATSHPDEFVMQAARDRTCA